MELLSESVSSRKRVFKFSLASFHILASEFLQSCSGIFNFSLASFHFSLVSFHHVDSESLRVVHMFFSVLKKSLCPTWQMGVILSKRTLQCFYWF